ncbi:hypothetical protein CALCODRAFT_476249 [Calocera cornea HHB12733]|uniref:Uncharacterized protein n=1 Tax=Calocera cornea HHB12733 TaxID=1353952 RepID=A0A165D603_9BASI|nr:hypothetical protein CALCODRAFT_476249 [Calocera cornea HHB12733]
MPYLRILPIDNVHRMGAMMGAGVGLTIGFIFGSYSILRHVLSVVMSAGMLIMRPRGGAGPRGFLPTLSQYMLSSAATFSFFLAIGSVIRNEDDPMLAARGRLVPYTQFTHDAGLVRRRWAEERQRTMGDRK